MSQPPFYISDWNALARLVSDYEKNGIYLVTGTNSAHHCLPLLRAKWASAPFEIMEIQTGEKNKTLETVTGIWNRLLEKGATQHSLLICLGGGVVCDMAAFAASCFKRGMPFVLIPTTLLSMVDASLGGKTGVNLQNIKNQIGTFSNPEAVFMFPEFLESLPQREILSGFAEIIKHAVLQGPKAFQMISEVDPLHPGSLLPVLENSIRFKLKMTRQDLLEKGKRKVLNFGHTIGHALESYSMEGDPNSLTHGEAVALGMWIEAALSKEVCRLPETVFLRIKTLILKHFDLYPLKKEAVETILGLMFHDKKRTLPQRINFTLLEAMGKPVIDCYPSEQAIRKGLELLVSR